MIQRELVPGKLRIVRRIGAGGMGVVYEAIHLGLDRRVAVKVIHPLSSESAEARTRFFREARAMALLRSEHIVQVLDVDTLPEGDPFMVMEYLEGRDLKRELVKRGPLPVAEAVGYLIQAATGVAAAHGAGIIHRDIKPANIFITNLDGARRAKILDFGVAKLSASPEQGLTGPTTQLGTPLYMSPEQIAGLEADSRCDVWALGVVLFQLLTGYSPFRAKGEGMLSAVLNGTAPPLHEVRDDVPPALSQVVARCLEKVHGARLESALELAAALAPFGPREPLVRPSRRAPRGSSAPPPTLLVDNDLVELVSVPRAPAPLSVRESITVTHPGRAAAHATDSDPTALFRAAKPSLAPLASPPVVSSSVRSRPPRSVRWTLLALPIGGLLVLGLVLGLCLPLFRPTNEVPAVAPLRASTNAVAPLANAPSSELAVATVVEAAPARAAPSMSAPKPTLPVPARSRAALLENPQRVSVPGTSTESRKRPTPVLPAPPAGGTSVPLHL